MWTLLDLVGHGGLIIGIICAAAAVAAVIFVPSPIKHYVVAACLLAAVATQIYSEGYHSADVEWRAKYDKALADLNDRNEKAVIAAQQAERAKAQELQQAINDQVNQLTEQSGKDQDELDRLRAVIASSKTAKNALDPGIRRVIRGGGK